MKISNVFPHSERVTVFIQGKGPFRMRARLTPQALNHVAKNPNHVFSDLRKEVLMIPSQEHLLYACERYVDKIGIYVNPDDYIASTKP